MNFKIEKQNISAKFPALKGQESFVYHLIFDSEKEDDLAVIIPLWNTDLKKLADKIVNEVD